MSDSLSSEQNESVNASTFVLYNIEDVVWRSLDGFEGPPASEFSSGLFPSPEDNDIEIDIDWNILENRVLNDGGSGDAVELDDETRAPFPRGQQYVTDTLNQVTEQLRDRIGWLPPPEDIGRVLNDGGSGDGDELDDETIALLTRQQQYVRDTLLQVADEMRELVTHIRNVIDASRTTPSPEEIIEAIPVVRVSSKDIVQKLECPICLEDFRIDERAQKLPCSHMFHADCIAPWWNFRFTCPFCKRQLTLGEEEASDAADNNSDEEEAGDHDGNNSDDATEASTGNDTDTGGISESTNTIAIAKTPDTDNDNHPQD